MFKQRLQIESEILPPLNSLILSFQGPAKVIRKRHDKLLDFDSASMKSKSARDPEQARMVSIQRINSC